jgi:bifunctional enzyme CysN/CysC
VDARHGVQIQTKRHSFIVSLLGIKHILVAVNKMDLVGFNRAVFEKIRADYLEFAKKLGLPDIHFIPMSALNGDNVVNRSEATPWFDGQPLMELLNTLEIGQDENFAELRFPVQWVNRPNLNFRGFSGTLAAGILKKGDPIMVLPSRKTSRVKSIVTYDGELVEAFPPQAITVTLEDEIDVSRGDMLVRPDHEPTLDSRFNANIVWMAETPLIPGRQYLFKQTTRTVAGSVAKVHHRIDVNTLETHPAVQLNLNEIGLCEIALSSAIAFDRYSRCKGTGSFIVIDRLTNVTVGAGMIESSAIRKAEIRRVTPQERATRFGQKAITFWLSGAERREAAYGLERRLFDRGYVCVVLDEEALGNQAGFVARNFNQAGIICLCSAPDNALPHEDAANVILPAESLEIDEVIKLLSLAHPGQPDFQI